MRLNPVAAFWAAYVLTRPLGASFADWMGVPARRSGLGWGTGPVSLVLAVLIVTLVAYQAVAHRRRRFGGRRLTVKCQVSVTCVATVVSGARSVPLPRRCCW
ncbi:hypothetical protein [Streptomyces sp. H39-C1]|uniref:hypothetical protein n=1 Tax=Streptomyces sp. H39-C1 TaxID=3004355 RepID=UPI002F35D57A